MAGGPITLVQLREVVQPIMNDNFAGVYAQRRNQWKPIFKEFEGIKRASHVETVLFGLGNAPILGDGAPSQFDVGGTLYTIYVPYDVISLGFGLTERAIEDSDYIDLAKTYSNHLAQSMYETEEWLAANVLNYGFNTSFTQMGGDGKPLFSASHPLAINGVSSNLMTPATLSMTSAEEMLIEIGLAVDSRGKKINLSAERLVVPTALQFQAPVVLKSILNPDATTASNAINPINSENSIAQGYQVVTRLTSDTAWFITTDLNAKGDKGLCKVNRYGLRTRSQEDFNTASMQFIASMRYRFTWIDWRGIYGNAGA